MNDDLFKRFRKLFKEDVSYSYYSLRGIPGPNTKKVINPLPEELTEEQFDQLLDITKEKNLLSETNGVFQYIPDWLAYILSLLVPYDDSKRDRFKKVLNRLSELTVFANKNSSWHHDITGRYNQLEQEPSSKGRRGGFPIDEVGEDDELFVLLRYADSANFSKEDREYFEKYLEDNPQISQTYYGTFNSNGKVFYDPLVISTYRSLSPEFIKRNWEKIIFTNIVKEKRFSLELDLQELIFGKILENNINYVMEVIAGRTDKIHISEEDISAMILRYTIL